jgi:hydroxyethylthiazole kinase
MMNNIEVALKDLRAKKPLILNLTNYVTMDFMANTITAIGAAPIMTVCTEELEELIQVVHCVNINTGTLDGAFIERCKLAVTLAHKYNKPVVLDPVGAGGVSQIRNKTASDLMSYASIIRGNASEIMGLAKASGKTIGVESTNSTYEARESALSISKAHGATVVVTGPIDFVTDGKREQEVPYGSSLMPLVIGTGCVLAPVIGAFRSVVLDDFKASVLATHYFALCGELAAKTACHPGTFKSHFIDNLHAADFKKLKEIYDK